MEVFSTMSAEDPEFSYVMDVDVESKNKTLLWTNDRSKMQYHNFGDVITFDTTYRINLYGMSFGLFVDVNNHFQSIILAGVLIKGETIESFECIFAEFIKLMGGKHPMIVLTDQARTMEVANKVMPNTTHRLCKWRVLRKANEHLGKHYTKKSDFRAEFHKIYEVRYKWVKPFFSGKFCAKQTSTQRSESANHLLKAYIPPSCLMNLFIRQYNKIQFDREAEEGFQEKRTRLGGVVLRSNFPLEEHASKLYTRTMFEMFAQFVCHST